MKLLSLIEISIETALLIVLIQGIRVVFRKQIHPNVRYALWIFAALRILVPVKLEIPVALPQYMTYVPLVHYMLEQQESVEYNRNILAGDMEYEVSMSSDGTADRKNTASSDQTEMTGNASTGGIGYVSSPSSDSMKDAAYDGTNSGYEDGLPVMVAVEPNMTEDTDRIQNSETISETVNSDKDVIAESAPGKSGGRSGTSIMYIVIKSLYVVWLLGILAMAAYVLAGNIRMHRYLRQERKELRILPNGLKVYAVPGYNCLFGMIHPAIYVSGRYGGLKEPTADGERAFERKQAADRKKVFDWKQVSVQKKVDEQEQGTDQKKIWEREQVSDAQIMEYVISHEMEHYRVKDHIWQMVRILCLILQWFNPFVWWAYRFSKQDCELACDYRTTKGMDREERYTYGESLLAVLESNLTYRHRLTVATSMGEQKRFLSERIRNIMNRPTKKHMILTAGIVAVLMAGCIISVSLYVKNQSDNREIAGNQEDSTGQQVLKSQEERERKKPPTQEEVEHARAQALAGMTEEEIAEFKSYVKNENQLWENRYFSNFFSDIEDPNSMMWNVLEESGDVQCGWAEELDSNGNIVGRVPVIAYNEKSADMCVEELEQYYDMVQSDTLKQDIEDLIYNYRMAKDTHRWEYAAEIFHMYHDMDYYLLRYGREDVGKYTMDQSFVSRYYGVLHEYDRQQNVSLASVMQTPQPTNLDAVNVYAAKAPVYPELDEELLERQLNRTRWIDDMIREDANLPLHGCEGYYISTIPVICYNAQSNQYAVNGNYLVFEDITNPDNNAGLQAVLSTDGSYQTSGFISGLIPKYLTEIVIANPDQEYIFLYNGTDMCMIDEDNTIYTSPYSDEIQVVGDYYHALDYENIAVSYRNLTDSAHLLYYRDDDSDGSYVRQTLPDIAGIRGEQQMDDKILDEYTLYDQRIYRVSIAEDGYIHLFYSTDAGKSWNQTVIRDEVSEDGQVYVCFEDPKIGHILYCSDPGTGIMQKVLYVSKDGGRTFEHQKEITAEIAGYPTDLLYTMRGVGYITVTYHGVNEYLYRYDERSGWQPFHVELPIQDYLYVNGVGINKTENGYQMDLEVVTANGGEIYSYTSSNGEDWGLKGE